MAHSGLEDGTENNHFVDESHLESVAWRHEDQSRLQELLHVYGSDSLRKRSVSRDSNEDMERSFPLTA